MATNHPRPTSPHLQVYQLPLTGIISISHRITGVLLTLGLVFLAIILCALSQGESAYAAMQETANFWPVKVIYWGFIYALFFHFCHGIRHLCWDVGGSFEPDKLSRYALLELVSALLLTAATWIFI